MGWGGWGLGGGASALAVCRAEPPPTTSTAWCCRRGPPGGGGRGRRRSHASGCARHFAGLSTPTPSRLQYAQFPSTHRAQIQTGRSPPPAAALSRAPPGSSATHRAIAAKRLAFLTPRLPPLPPRRARAHTVHLAPPCHATHSSRLPPTTTARTKPGPHQLRRQLLHRRARYSRNRQGAAQLGRGGDELLQPEPAHVRTHACMCVCAQQVCASLRTHARMQRGDVGGCGRRGRSARRQWG